MAAAVQSEWVTITVNDIELKVPKGELIVESVKRLGLEIPIFCYHPRMKPVGMCRMCLVEVGFKQPDGSVRKMPKPQAGCTLPADNNMVVYTDTEMVHRDRKGVLEFLLINHPLDCPICDRGGECPLQNNTIFYGPSTSRFTELKRHAHKAFPLSQYVTLDLERCIQCGRCVRFTEEISGDSQLAFRFRGADMQPSTYQLTDFESKFSGNVIEICPVGALTNAKYRFRARPWDLETKPGTCLECANQCSTYFDYRAGKFVRLNGRINESVNEEWTCDKGKFGHEYYNTPDRLTQVLVREGREFRKGTWMEAYEQILKEFGLRKPEEEGILVGGRVSNEGMYLLQRVAREVFHTDNLDSRWTRTLVPTTETWHAKLGVPQHQNTIASLENASTILTFGNNFADEQPIVYLRVRKAWFQNRANVIVASHEPVEADAFATCVLRYAPGKAAALAEGLHHLVKGTGDAAEVARATGVALPSLQQAVALLSGPTVVLTSDSMLNDPTGADAVLHLAQMARAQGGTFSCFKTYGNAQGAEDMGILPDRDASGRVLGQPGLTAQQMLEKAANFELKLLWLVDCDPFTLHPDEQLVRDALESVEYLIVQGSVGGEAAGYASLVLPSAAPAEQDGTYTNIEGRVQRLRQVLPTPGDAKAHWRIFAELLLRSKPGKPYFGATEVLDEIAQTVPGYESVHRDLEGDGTLVRSGAPVTA